MAQQKILGTFSLSMIAVAGIVSLRSLPFMASLGFSLVFFYLLAALLFLIPSALVCAELASTWPKAGGVYLWVERAFGRKTGFFTIWSEWFNNTISFPTTLAFIAATITYSFNPSFANNKLFILPMMLIIIWGCTVYNFLGIKASSRLNIIGVFLGTLLPALLIGILGFSWIFFKKPMQVDFSLRHFFPPLHIKNMALFIGTLSSYAGMQITAFHAQNVKNPQRSFPRAIMLSVFLILIITVFSALAIAVVVPTKHLSLISGVMDGFNIFFNAFHLRWVLPIFAVLIVLSGLSSLSAWVLAPARGLLVAAQDGLFPKWFAHENNEGMPTRILLLQACVATVLSLLFIFAPTFNEAFWMLMVLTSQFTLVMYVFVFSAAIRLRYSESKTLRPFKIPLGHTGIWLVAGASSILCLCSVILGYFPPEQIHVSDLYHYELFLIIGNVIYLLIPFIIYRATHRQVKSR